MPDRSDTVAIAAPRFHTRPLSYTARCRGRPRDASSSASSSSASAAASFGKLQMATTTSPPSTSPSAAATTAAARSRLALSFSGASPAETLCASEKDATYISTLAEQACTAAQLLCGGPIAQGWKSEVHVAAALAYYALTTCRSHPTPGEEHCDLTLVHTQDERPAGTPRRVLHIALVVLAPYCFERLSARLLAFARRLTTRPTSRARSRLLRVRRCVFSARRR